MKKRLIRNIIIAAAGLMLFAVSAAGQIKPEKLKPLLPQSFEEKLSAADVVALGTVEAVTPDPAKPGMENRNPRPMVADVLVEKVFKGSIPPGTIKVAFDLNAKPSKPELVKLKKGERAVLYLVRGIGSSNYKFIGPSIGKERPDEKFLAALDSASKEQKLAFAVEAELAVAGGSNDAGAAGVLFVMENKGALPVVFSSMPDAAADLIAVGPDGKVLQARKDSSRSAAISAKLILGPGQFFGYRANLSELFAIEQPGNYTVTAAFKSADTGEKGVWSGVVETKPVTVEVK